MSSNLLKMVAVMLAGSLLVACGQDRTPQLMSAASGKLGPDEFSILPNKPLEEPGSYTELPSPTPFGHNRADASPIEDAVTILGGESPSELGDIPSVDRQLVSYTGRFGRESRIREELAAEDFQFRRDNQGLVLERVFNVNVYYRAYEYMALDSYAELDRFRALGVRTPAAPPKPPEEEG